MKQIDQRKSAMKITLVSSIDMYKNLGHRMQRLARYLHNDIGHIGYLYFREYVDWAPEHERKLENTFPQEDDFGEGLYGTAVKRPISLWNLLRSVLKRIHPKYRDSKLSAWLTAKIHRYESKMLGKYIHKYFPETEIVIAFGPWAGIACVEYKRKHPEVLFVYEDVDYYPGFCGEHYARYVDKMEQEIVRNADLVVSVSQNLANLRKYQGAKGVIMIPNGTSIEHFTVTKPFFAQTKPRLVWVGYIDDWVAIDEMIEAVNILKQDFPGIFFDIYGGGPLTEELIEKVKNHELTENIRFLGRMEYLELPKALSGATIGMAPFKSNIVMKYACVIKVRDYMASGIPILTTGVGELKDLMRESQSGFAVKPYAESIAIGIKNILSSKEQWEQMSRNGREYAKKFEWDYLFHLELKEIQTLII